MRNSIQGKLVTLLQVAMLILSIAGAGLSVQAQERYREARDIVARIQEDVHRSAGLTKEEKKERERFDNFQRRISKFDRELSKGKFDKDELDQAIEDLKNIVEHNTLAGPDRDLLTQDLRDLRQLRQNRGRY